MGMFDKLKSFSLERGGYLFNMVMLGLGVLGLMAVVHNVSYLKPVDGAEWRMDEETGRLTVVGITDQDEGVFQLGDRLLRIDERAIASESAREDFLYQLPIGSRHLYVLERGQERYEPWVTIRGVKESPSRGYYLFAFSGFIYLIFFFLIRSRTGGPQTHTDLMFFCLLVYMAFVFHPTDRLSPMDWVSLALDYFGRFLLPSALLAVGLARAFPNAKLRPFFQGAHWLPSALLLALIGYWLLSQYDATGFAPSASSFAGLQRVQGYWGGGLIFLACIALAIAAKRRTGSYGFAALAALAWLPYTMTLWRLNAPSSTMLAGIMPTILPIGLVLAWSRRGELYLGDIGKKIAIYLSVVLALFLAYFLFLGAFRYLAGPRMDQTTQMVILGLGILFATASYNSLSQFAAEAMDRLIYGKRYESLQALSDFAGINRADMNIDRFLSIIFNRVRNAFPVARGCAYKAIGRNRFQPALQDAELSDFMLDDAHPLLMEGDIVHGQTVKAHALNIDRKNPFSPTDYICPIRVTDRLAALIVFATEDNGSRELSPEELRLLKSLLRQCDVLMENMELYQQLHQRTVSLTHMKEYNENIIESSRLGILTTDNMGKAVSCNSALVEIVGRGKEEILERHFGELFRPEAIKSRHRVRSGFSVEGRYLNGRGEAVDLEIQETPLRTKENDVYGTLYLVEDVREKKKLREQIIQQEKLASIGLLAAGVAHEINTPLTGIGSYSQMLVKDPNLQETHKELLRLIQEQSQRAANIVTELLDFSRKESRPKGPVDLLQVLNQTLRFLSHQMQKRRVRATINEPSQPPVIEGYGNQIQQVFLNLIVNSLDAMPDGGDLAISFAVRRRSISARFKDNGVGMDEETKSHIFDPFFTTKEVGKGTGLGLAVVYNILREHGARVEVDSSPGRGCEFILMFPAQGQRALPWSVKPAAGSMEQDPDDTLSLLRR